MELDSILFYFTNFPAKQIAQQKNTKPRCGQREIFQTNFKKVLSGIQQTLRHPIPEKIIPKMKLGELILK